MTVFWNGWIYLLSLGPLVLLTWLLYSNYKDSVSDKDHHRRHETHDGIGESFQPIPFWWAAVMYCLIAFAFIYLLLFPGLGSYNGLLSWSSMDSLHEEQQRINSKTDALLTQYESVDAEALSQDANAMLLGRRLFRQHCAACHGLNAQAEKNFPNLTDDDWLYEKSITSFQQTIRQGRQAAMPAWIGTLDKAHFDAVALYVHQLQFEENVSAEVNEALGDKKLPSHAVATPEALVKGEQVYKQFCASCHGAEGQGSRAVGAPNLTDDIWLYGGSLTEIRASLRLGRKGQMPAFEQILSDGEIHLLSAYVLSLSQE